jgi:hypothetical protein
VLHAALVPRLTAVGALELAAVSALLDTVRLRAEPDVRALARCGKREGALSVADLDKLCSLGGVDAPFAAFVWESFVPSKVKSFSCLLVQSRLQCRAALLLPADAVCPICSAACKSASHIIFVCPFARRRRFWSLLGANYDGCTDVRQLSDLPGVVHEVTGSSFTLLCCWNLWKHRNGMVFRGDRPCLQRLVQPCVEDARVWRVSSW